jgi:hypothetical protein
VSKSSNQKTRACKRTIGQTATNSSGARYEELLMDDRREMHNRHRMARVESGAIITIYYDFTAEFHTTWLFMRSFFFGVKKNRYRQSCFGSGSRSNRI